MERSNIVISIAMGIILSITSAHAGSISYTVWQTQGVRLWVSRSIVETLGTTETSRTVLAMAGVVSKVQGIPSDWKDIRIELARDGKSTGYEHNPTIAGSVQVMPHTTAIIILNGPSFIRRSFLAGMYSSVGLEKFIRRDKHFPELFREALAGLCHVHADGERSPQFQFIRANALDQNNVIVNRLNAEGLESLNGEITNGLYDLQRAAVIIAFYDLFYQDNTAIRAIVEELGKMTPPYSWHAIIDWAERRYPGWKNRHHVLQWPRQGTFFIPYWHTLTDPSRGVMAMVNRNALGALEPFNMEFHLSPLRSIHLSLPNGARTESIEDLFGARWESGTLNIPSLNGGVRTIEAPHDCRTSPNMRR